jgi:hypothetical protein
MRPRLPAFTVSLAVLGISDRRLQPTFFKDEHPRSGRPLAWRSHLRDALTSSSWDSRPTTRFGGSLNQTAAFSSDRLCSKTRPLTHLSFPNLLRLSLSLGRSSFSHLGSLPHVRVNDRDSTHQCAFHRGGTLRGLSRGAGFATSSPRSRRCLPNRFHVWLAPCHERVTACLGERRRLPTSAARLGPRTRPRTSGPSSLARRGSPRRRGEVECLSRRGR